MLSLLHKVVSIPTIYDLSQKLAGGDVARAVLKKEFSILPKAGSALDVGGGTGLMRPLLPANWEYTCLDNDPQKLSGFRKKFPSEKTILSKLQLQRSQNQAVYTTCAFYPPYRTTFRAQN
jgi:ubiquinone/menaquinone biosynthesis C-methylase UbiE